MKLIKYTGLAVIAAAALFVSCADEPQTQVQFGPDKDQITVGPERTVEAVKVSASEKWVATTDQSWLYITPADGNSSQECNIRIDSTFQDNIRQGEIRFSSGGQVRVLKISQTGFAKQILVEGAENGAYQVALPDYATFGTTHFDVNVTTNVDFDVKIEDRTVIPDQQSVRVDEYPVAAWLKTGEYKLDLVQFKPRTVKIRFSWEYNTKWWKQNAVIRFIPKNAGELTRQDVIAIEQSAAPRITDDRAGDSIAVLSIARQLNLSGGFDSSKPMEDWGDDLKLYTKGDGMDKNGKPLAGRVKYARFYFFDTKAPLPYEVRYLTRAEEVIFYSNVNSTIRDIELGTSIVELAKYGYLKRLTIDAYGIKALPDEFAQLGSCLEELSLGSENFIRIPDLINKENFPHLKKFRMGANRVTNVYDLSNSPVDNPGLGGELPRRLFEWENLEELSLSYNYFEGSIPDMKDYGVVWTAEDGYSSLVGKPKVLPNIKRLALNLNRLTGELPDWLLNHPNIKDWNPYVLLFPQEGKDSQGKSAGFTNEPDKLQPPVKD